MPRRNPESETAIGLIVNPKLKEPVFATFDDVYEITIFRMRGGVWVYEGRGYYDEDDPIVEQIGLLRTHTPSGVRSKGMGFGTSLYTGLCLGAHFNNTGAIDVSRTVDGDGVMSVPGTRSLDANKWWQRALQLNLVTRDAVESEYENVEATAELGSVLMGESLEHEGVDAEVTYVNDVNVDVRSSTPVDTYPYDNAMSAELVLAEFVGPVQMTYEYEGSTPRKFIEDDSVRELWKELKEESRDTTIDTIETDLIVALDVRSLSLQTMNLLGILMQYEGVDEEILSQFRMRWELGLDPSEPIRQIELPLKANSAEMRRAYEAVEHAQHLRKQTDWSRLQELP